MPCSQKTRTRDSHHLLKDIWLNRISRAFGFIVTHLNSFSRPRRVVRPAYSLWWLLLCLGCLTLRQKSQKRTRWTCCKRDGTHDQVDVGEEKTELLEISNEKCCGLVLDLFPHLAAPMLAFCSRSWRWSHLWGLSRGSAWAISIGRLQGTFWGDQQIRRIASDHSCHLENAPRDPTEGNYWYVVWRECEGNGIGLPDTKPAWRNILIVKPN